MGQKYYQYGDNCQNTGLSVDENLGELVDDKYSNTPVRYQKMSLSYVRI